MPWQDQGKESDHEGNMGRDLCYTQRNGGPKKTGSTSGTGKEPREGSDAIRFSKEKQNFLCGQTRFAQFVGVTFLVIKKPFVNNIFSSHFSLRCNQAPLLELHSSSSSKLSQASAPGWWRHVHSASQEPQFSLQCYIKGPVFPL